MGQLLENYKTYGKLLGDENEFKDHIGEIGLSSGSPLGYFVVRLLADTYNVQIRLFQVRPPDHNLTTTVHIHTLTYATNLPFRVTCTCSKCYIKHNTQGDSFISFNDKSNRIVNIARGMKQTQTQTHANMNAIARV